MNTDLNESNLTIPLIPSLNKIQKKPRTAGTASSSESLKTKDSNRQIDKFNAQEGYRSNFRPDEKDETTISPKSYSNTPEIQGANSRS